MSNTNKRPFILDLLKTLKELRVNPELFPPKDYPKYELPQYRAWRNDMESAIKHICGKDSHYFKEYRGLVFYQGFGFGFPWDKKTNREALATAFNHSEGLLLSMLKYLDLVDEIVDILPEHKRYLLTKIDRYFNDSELRTLCFEMRIDYEHLVGAEKLSKIRELILYCESRGLVNNLVKECKKQRPSVYWEENNFK